uniref:Ig-like domain-containing protein n=1 Tax=Astatotilapia calliptera TaxID=8154 RepID=A0A3P8QBR0_ASTCA
MADSSEIVMSSERCVSEGEAVSLPCYFSTTGKARWSVRWEKNGEDLNPPQVTEGNGFESRVSISSDWYQRADLSLTIKRVHLRDRGVYFCDVDKTERHSSAVRLRVREIVPESLTSTLKPTLMVSTLTLNVRHKFEIHQQWLWRTLQQQRGGGGRRH